MSEHASYIKSIHDLTYRIDLHQRKQLLEIGEALARLRDEIGGEPVDGPLANA